MSPYRDNTEDQPKLANHWDHLICRLLGHEWKHSSNSARKTCIRCGREEFCECENCVDEQFKELNRNWRALVRQVLGITKVGVLEVDDFTKDGGPW